MKPGILLTPNNFTMQDGKYKHPARLESNICNDFEDKDECMDKMKNVQGFTGFVEKKFTSNV